MTPGDVTASAKIIQSLPEAQKHVVYRVYTSSLRSEWIFYTALSSVALLLSLLISKQVLSRKHEIFNAGLEVQEAARLGEKNRRNGRDIEEGSSDDVATKPET